MTKVVFSIINGINGFTDRAQRCEISGGTDIDFDTGWIYNSGYTLDVNRGYRLFLNYRSNIITYFYSIDQQNQNYMILPINTGNAQYIETGFTTTRYYDNTSNYTNVPSVPTYIGYGTYGEFVENDYYELDKVNLYLNDVPNYPVCTTDFVKNTTYSGITLTGVVNPYDLLTNVYFEWCSGSTTNYTTSGFTASYTSFGDHNVELTIPIISGETEYHYRIKSVNSSGTTYGRDVKFSSGNIPAIASVGISSNTLTGITLQATVSPKYLSTSVDFEWGTGTTGATYDYTSVAFQSPVAGYTVVPYTISSICTKVLTGLTIDLSYHYRIKATNSLGITYSSNYRFSTINDSFESASGSNPPLNWAIQLVSGTTSGISFVSSNSFPTITAAYDGAIFVSYNSFNINFGATRLKKTLSYSTVGKSTATVNFAWYEDTAYNTSNDRVQVQWSTDNINWTTDGTFLRYNAVAGWKTKSQALSAGALGQSTLYIGFLFISAYGNNCSLDYVTFVTT